MPTRLPGLSSLQSASQCCQYGRRQADICRQLVLECSNHSPCSPQHGWAVCHTIISYIYGLEERRRRQCRVCILLKRMCIAGLLNSAHCKAPQAPESVRCHLLPCMGGRAAGCRQYCHQWPICSSCVSRSHDRMTLYHACTWHAAPLLASIDLCFMRCEQTSWCCRRAVLRP